MSDVAARTSERYTWADYRTWSDDQRWEIIDGDAYLMSPGPATRHQRVSGELHRQLANHFLGKRCSVFAAPMDVVLSDVNVVQPDLLVVCDPERIKRTHIAGAPTLVVEVLSGHSTSRDRLLKLGLYARCGVAEYWIVTPWPSMIEVYRLDAGRYAVHGVYGKDRAEPLTSPTFPELTLDLGLVFDFPLEPGEEPPAVREPPPRYRPERCGADAAPAYSTTGSPNPK